MKMKLMLLLSCLSVAIIAEGEAFKDSYFNRLQLLFEVFYRVHDNFAFEDLKNFGRELNLDKSAYDFWTVEMDNFLLAYQTGRLLPRGEFFGGLIESHAEQAHNLFQFFYNAGSIETMLRNVCWARVNINEGVFFQAVNLVKFYYRALRGYDMPLIHEVFPEHFFSWKYVFKAKDFNAVQLEGQTTGKDVSKSWQWWQAMELHENWHVEQEFILRDNIYKRLNDRKYWNTLKDLKFWWLPVDYTREFDDETELTAMSYFLEDVEWNSYWYYLNIGYATEFSADKLTLNAGHRGEFWLFTVQQLMTRYYFERLSHKLGDIPQFSWSASKNNNSLFGTYLVASTHQSFRPYQGSDTNSELLTQARDKLTKIEEAIELGYYELKNGAKINLREPAAVEVLGNLLQSNVDAIDAEESSFNWYRQAMTAFSDWNNYELPNLLLNFETMLRDPFTYSFHQKIVDIYHAFQAKLPPYTRDELAADGVSLEHINVSAFETFFDLADFDVSSLTRQQLKFEKSGFQQENVLLARQMRLNHKTLRYNITIRSDMYQSVNIHLFLGPAIDEHGKLLTLLESRKHFFALDQYKCQVREGLNDCSRNSDEASWTGHDRRTLAERYHYVRYVTAGFPYMPKNYDWEDACGFPKRLVLPRGWPQGMPMRLFALVEKGTKADVNRQQNCLRRISTKAFGYPFDRTITDESLYEMPNMRFLDINITHVDPFESYFKHYSDLGKFDYNFLEGYYHKNVDYKKYRAPAK